MWIEFKERLVNLHEAISIFCEAGHSFDRTYYYVTIQFTRNITIKEKYETRKEGDARIEQIMQLIKNSVA